jgi:acyl-CoA hydrolase
MLTWIFKAVLMSLLGSPVNAFRKQEHIMRLISRMIAYFWSSFYFILSIFLFFKRFLGFERKYMLRYRAKTPAESRVELTEMLVPSQADIRGYAFGGVILSWVDICAGIASFTHADHIAVTASLDAVHFVSPAKVGDVVIIRGQVNRTWKTSMEVGVHVEAENMLTGERRYCCHAYLTFVAVDKDSRPIPVPQILPLTESDRKRYDEAGKRKHERLELRKQHEKRLMETEGPHFNLDPFLTEFKYEQGHGSRKWKYCSDSCTEMFKVVLPQDANMLNITFGGVIMRWIEECAAIAASRHARAHLLTTSIDSLQFLAPTKVGDAIHLRACVTHAFNTSMEVYVHVSADDHLTGEKVFTNDAYLTITAVNESNEPVEVPKVRPLTREEIMRYAGAQERREARLRLRDEFKRASFSD